MRQAVKLNPNDDEAIFNLGKVLLEIGEIYEAENLFLAMAEIVSEKLKQPLMEMLIQRAKIYQDKRYFATANKFFEAILLIDPNNDKFAVLRRTRTIFAND